MAYALDIAKPGLVFLKDTWRILSSPPEHETYKKLEAQKVRNIAQCIIGQDVGLGLGTLDSRFHETQTGVYVNEPWNNGSHSLRPFRHYQLVLEYIKLGLSGFRNVRELVILIRDAFIAFDDAFMLAHILHRDISIGNIMIKEENGMVIGVLIDWDLCKDLNVSPSSGRRHERTGTWAFMSARLVAGSTQHTRNDDAESFYHILNYIASR
ncbi:hypothetical protein BDN72DRAFT_803862, partial [Pluteus cervinus]